LGINQLTDPFPEMFYLSISIIVIFAYFGGKLGWPKWLVPICI